VRRNVGYSTIGNLALELSSYNLKGKGTLQETKSLA
jgi:hypothetical protein